MTDPADNGSQDEIDALMHEIEALEKEVSQNAEPAVAEGAAEASPAASEPTPAEPTSTDAMTDKLIAEADQLASQITNELDSEIAKQMDEFKGPQSDSGGDSLEDTLGDVKPEEPAHASILESVSKSSKSEPRRLGIVKSSKESSDGSLSIRLTGQMTLNLEYEYRGQEVKISFENDYLVARLTDGTEFKVPVARGASSDSQVA